MNREKGFREAITKDGKFTLLTTEYKDGNFASSQEAATGFITGNSDLVGLYGTNEARPSAWATLSKIPARR